MITRVSSIDFVAQNNISRFNKKSDNKILNYKSFDNISFGSAKTQEPIEEIISLAFKKLQEKSPIGFFRKYEGKSKDNTNVQIRETSMDCDAILTLSNLKSKTKYALYELRKTSEEGAKIISLETHKVQTDLKILNGIKRILQDLI